jgi:hypothetical protein
MDAESAHHGIAIAKMGRRRMHATAALGRGLLRRRYHWSRTPSMAFEKVGIEAGIAALIAFKEH